ncbi:MAG TPA: hypothetical protein VKT77_06785 [Chthonomonadaceae bacterium]|nr:hypothetical protein [Chthonomonadaceae bacterium]
MRRISRSVVIVIAIWLLAGAVILPSAWWLFRNVSIVTNITGEEK